MTTRKGPAGPDPEVLHPLPGQDRVVFLKPLAKGRTNVTVGPFAYYDDPENAQGFFDANVLHHYEFLGDHLTIGAFTAIATGARIIMNGATHYMGGFSTYPFQVFAGWQAEPDLQKFLDQSRGDTVIGPDVWIGGEAWIMPGVTIGAGAIVAAKSVVTKDVPPYAVVAGNPAQVVRQRFDDKTVARLLNIAWWDWPAEKIAAHSAAITGGDLELLESL